MPDTELVPAPTLGKETSTKCSPPLDVRSTVSNPSSQDPTTILVAVCSTNTIPDATNTLVEPYEVFKTIISDITEFLTFLISPIYYETESVLLQMEYTKKELIDVADNYKASMYHLKKPSVKD